MSSELNEAVEEIKAYYRKRATTDKYATSPDFNLREIETHYMANWLKDGLDVLDVGCGNGYSTLCHAAKFRSLFTGIDFVPEMVEAAQALRSKFPLVGTVRFQVGDATTLTFGDKEFDVVMSQRCLLNLPSRDAQWAAMSEIARVLRPDGLYLMLEGTLQGLRGLNEVRKLFGLDPIHKPGASSTRGWTFRGAPFRAFR